MQIGYKDENSYVKKNVASHADTWCKRRGFVSYSVLPDSEGVRSVAVAVGILTAVSAVRRATGYGSGHDPSAALRRVHVETVEL